MVYHRFQIGCDLLNICLILQLIYKRDHRGYSKHGMATLCGAEDWSGVYGTTDMQEGYNIVESKLLNIIDTIAPFRRIVISEKHRTIILWMSPGKFEFSLATYFC